MTAFEKLMHTVEETIANKQAELNWLKRQSAVCEKEEVKQYVEDILKNADKETACEALQFMTSLDFKVELINEENEEDFKWFIRAENREFNMNAFKTKEEAVEFCKKMEWKIISNIQ